MTTTDAPPAPLSRAAPASMPIADITIDPHYRRRDIGKLRDLQHHIRDHGLLQPVPVTADGTLIAGERRLRACQNLGWDHIPVTVAHDGRHTFELFGAEDDTGPCALPMTASERVRAGVRIEDLGRAAAAANRLLAQRHLASGQRIQVRDIAADLVGMPRHFYVQIRTLVLADAGFVACPGGYERSPASADATVSARTALDLVDRVWAGEEIRVPGVRVQLSINRIYTDWATANKTPPEPPPTISGDSGDGPAPDLPIIRTVRINQRDALAKALATLSGLCHGLASIAEIDPATTSEEAASWERDLSNASRTLRGLHKKIKEYAHGIR